MDRSEIRPFVGFVFFYVNKLPRNGEEIHNLTSYREQRMIIGKHAKALHRKIFRTECGIATYRKALFVNDPAFQRATARAKELDAPIILADVFALMRTLSPRAIEKCCEILDRCDVEICSAAHRRLWRKIGKTERLLATIEVNVARGVKSASIRRGLENSVRNSEPRGRRTVPRTRPLADERALHLAGIVDEILASLPEDTQLTDTTLSRALNEKGIPAAQGGPWSVSSAKQLLARLEKLGQLHLHRS